jgi:hypothetical protein
VWQLGSVQEFSWCPFHLITKSYCTFEIFRYKAYKERMQRMYVVPRYDPVFVEPNLKEYETQVCLNYCYFGKDACLNINNTAHITWIFHGYP